MAENRGMAQTRRDFVKAGAAGAAAQPGTDVVAADPAPRFEFSRRFYMQFMEPLGTTDSSVEAAWDRERDDWRKDLVEATRELAPDVVRWGGIYSRYYRWREGVGDPKKRPLTYNYAWGGYETNRVGTHEFTDFCRRVGAEPLYCVNFSGDGVERYRKDGRWGDAAEAAEWVAYANDSRQEERRRNGAANPLGIKLWQLGNETSYGKEVFTREECIRRTAEFAQAMRKRDPSIELIGWGDYGRGTEERELWAPELLRQAGEHIDAVAIHMMGMSPRRQETLLRGNRYQKDPAGAWEELLELSDVVEKRVTEIEQAVTARSARHWIAITEGHLSMVPHNANPILLEWLSAAYHARSMNIYHRHGAKVRMATGADFAGNRWTVNAVMMQTPRGASYPTPAGSVMRLFKRHNGRQGIAVKQAPADLDVAASRTDRRVYLHVLNKSFRRAVEARFAVEGMRVSGGKVWTIAPEDPRTAVGLDQPGVFAPRESALNAEGTWRFAPASVSAVMLELDGMGC